MPQEIERDLLKAEASLYEMQSRYPGLASRAAECRYTYDQAWANAIDEIVHRATAAGEKLPTVAAMEAEATIKVKEQMAAARLSEADLKAAQMIIDTNQSILSSIQTRARLVQMELSLAR